jgi:cytochrome c oxidase cbb3-type subunit I
MTDMAVTRKTMTLGEGGTALALVALAIISIFIAANAYTPEYAFHAYLFAAASAAAVFAIINHCAQLPCRPRLSTASPITI